MQQLLHLYHRSVIFCKHVLPGLCVHWSNNQASQFPSSHVLCIQVTSFPSLLLEQSSCLSQNKNCVILKTICFRVCSQKKIWTRPHQLWVPSVYMEFSSIFPANFASSDNLTCLKTTCQGMQNTHSVSCYKHITQVGCNTTLTLLYMHRTKEKG